jgi:hypothetical protein
VNNDRTPAAAGADSGASGPLGAIGNAWVRFWFTPTPITGMKVLRVASGILFCAWLLSFLGHQREFFSLNGWFDRQSYQDVVRRQHEIEQAFREGKMPPPQELAPAPIGWSVLYLAGNNDQTFQILYWASIAVLVLFTLGIGTRITGILTWVVVVSFLANPATSYDGDYLLGILAFYLMLGHLCTGFVNGNGSLLGMIFGPCDQMLWSRAKGEVRVSNAANWMMRLVQIHFAIIMVTSGLHKLQISDWWAGVALWYPLHPPFQTTLESLQRESASRESTLFFVSICTYAVLGWQIGLPLFAWRGGAVWRTLLLAGAAIGWAGATFLFKLPLFGPFVFICALSYIRPEEWAAVWSRLQGLSGSAAAAATPGPAKTAITAAVKK